MNLHWAPGCGWTSSASAPAALTRSLRRSATSPALPPALQAALSESGVEITAEHRVRPRTRRGTPPSTLDFSASAGPGFVPLAILRHPSGALTFHAPSPPDSAIPRSASSSPGTQHFLIPLTASSALTPRRGVVDSTLRMFLIRIASRAVEQVIRQGIQSAALEAEKAWWKRRGLSEGLHSVSLHQDRLQLAPASPASLPPGPCLLLLHGTFSDAAGSFAGLASTGALRRLLHDYGGRVYAWEHFTVSRSPSDNARQLLAALPAQARTYDALAYSRGGLVLRTLAELPGELGPDAYRFRLRRAVLAAVPQAGTPLASPGRWEDTFGFLATFLGLIPDSPLTPLTTAASFIADGLAWLAARATGSLPGLAAMDPSGPFLSSLRQSTPPTDSYFFIGANHHPPAGLWARLLDAGIDSFFGGANDLVVPTEGSLPAPFPASARACFGPGGNLPPATGTVHHLNLLAQPLASQVILHALARQPPGFPPLPDPLSFPSRRPWRGIRSALPSPLLSLPPVPAPVATLPSTPESPAASALAPAPLHRENDRTLHLTIIDSVGPENSTPRGSSPSTAQIIATYNGARVIEPFGLRDSGSPGAGTRFKKIIALDKQIQYYLEGRPLANGSPSTLPDDRGMREFGSLLFEALFTPAVRRLYDLARAEQHGQPLNLIFTSAIPWVAAKPWEFAFDSARGKFLATEEIHFVRNALTSVPAQRTSPGRSRLRILVVEAQPAGTAPLSADEEHNLIRHRFQPLIDSGLAEIEALPRATPGRLHECLVRQGFSRQPYDIVHFIGHGEFDSQAKEGRLLFHSTDGGTHIVETQTLRELLCTRGLQLVFLNACDTARDDHHHLNRGVATALVQGGLPAVVANQYKVLDPSAVAFAQQFYWALANGATLGQAAREARIAVNYSIEGEIIDWAVPVLYARDPDLQLCQPGSAVIPLVKPPTPPPAPAAASHRAPGPVTTVGVADIARHFTGLSDILERINSAQDRFRFRLVEVTTPLGVWQRHEGTTFLHAERMAAKLRHKPRELGVDILACITHWWMCDEDTLHLYNWWSGDPASPIFIFSTAGFELPSTGLDGGRVIANELAASIASHWAALQGRSLIHTGPPRDCPFYYNESRDPACITSPLRLRPGIRLRLLRSLPKDQNPKATVEALERILRAFDPPASPSPAFSRKSTQPTSRKVRRP